ncbi:MAG: SDR family oxidoreductase [Burkholderiales bacterium]|jgi:NAD(P)-dependent dehydrogenase (short-subunit alcohol dehydrogenase family)
MKDFAGKVAVITGAGSGFGREFARIGARLGMKLALADVQADALAATVAELEGQGARVFGEKTDVSKAEDMERLAARTVDAYGGAHLLFNNAGVAVGGLAWESSVRDWEWVLGVNVWGVIHGVRVFTPILLAQDEPGHIVNTASVAGLVNPQMMAVYNVSKHAVVSLSETLHHDLRLVNAKVGVSVLCPAFVPTGIHASDRNRPADLANEAPPTASQQALKAQLDKAVTSGKITAEQVADMTFDAIRDERFYVITHEKMMPSIELRLQDVVQRRNPTDPFTYKPDVAVRKAD